MVLFIAFDRSGRIRLTDDMRPWTGIKRNNLLLRHLRPLLTGYVIYLAG